MTDARIVRTRASLHDAILTLASQKPVTEITVSELATQADINRVTFYKHFVSPAEALRAALIAELEPVRRALLAPNGTPPTDSREVLLKTADLVLNHIEAHRKLYELSFADPDDGTVLSVLSDYFSDSLEQFLESPGMHTQDLPTCDMKYVTHFFGTGLVGAVHVWVRSGDSDRTGLLTAITNVFPSWWRA